MGHLFYADLGVTAGGSILTSTNPDLSLFQNIQSNLYWSGTEDAPGTHHAWVFVTDYGIQYSYAEDSEFFAWAVRPGDVAAVPEPTTLLLLGLGIAGLGFARRKKRKHAA